MESLQSIRMKWFAALFALALLSACGGGGGGGGSTSGGGGFGTGGTMTVNVVSLTTPTNTVVYSGDGTDTLLFGMSGSGQTLIEYSSPTIVVIPCATGTSPASYPITTPSLVCTGFSYYLMSGGIPTALYSGQTGTITLTSIGVIGQPVTGSFDVIAALSTNLTNTMRIWGTFSATRQ